METAVEAAVEVGAESARAALARGECSGHANLESNRAGQKEQA